MTVTEEFEIPFNDDYIYVDITIEASYGNLGIGSYEFWGIRGSDNRYGYEVDDISWDKTLFTEEQNDVIDEWIGNNTEKIDNLLESYKE
jgi:hypothetical protein